MTPLKTTINNRTKHRDYEINKKIFYEENGSLLRRIYSKFCVLERTINTNYKTIHCVKSFIRRSLQKNKKNSLTKKTTLV